MNDRLGDWVKNLTFQTIPGCGHWTQQERPDVVNGAVGVVSLGLSLGD